MYSTKQILIGNSGDKVSLLGNIVFKEAGQDKNKFVQQLDFLKKCNHPNFIQVEEISRLKYKMKRYPTFYDWIKNHSLSESLDRLTYLLNIVDSFPGSIRKILASSYFSKLESRTGYKYSGDFLIESKYGFVHGDLTISNILYDDDFIFIDPRGTEEQDYYDYGKLMQSFDMNYESLIIGEVNTKYFDFCSSAIEIMLSRYNEKYLKFYLAVHLLGAVPFLINNNRHEIANSFLNRGHQIFEEIGISYYES